MLRLARVQTRDVPGLPDLDVRLRPLTAIIGPRSTGKSRLLAAIAWLLTGRPSLAPASAPTAPCVAGELASGEAPTRIVERSVDSRPLPPLPRCRYLTVRGRLKKGATNSSAAGAAAMVADLERRTAERRSGEVLIVDEPELMLTPQMQRYLYRLLRAHAERNQVVYATRSTALLDAAHHDEIVRLDLTAAGLAVRRAPIELLTDSERLRLSAEFDHERSEMFFATAVVLVEGQTEKQSLPAVFRALGHDVDQLGISIVEVGGKSNLPLYGRVLAELAIPFVVVFDSDRGAPAAADNAAIHAAAAGAPIFTFEPDFEAAAGLKSHEDKVINAWRRFSLLTPERIPPIFRAIVDAAVALAR